MPTFLAFALRVTVGITTAILIPALLALWWGGGIIKLSFAFLLSCVLVVVQIRAYAAEYHALLRAHPPVERGPRR